MATSAQQIRSYKGPAILSYGFRPFFLFGALWAALAVGVWLPMLGGALALPTALAPVHWHAHELAFGFVPAIIAGFLLTAVPNWTGRLPITGRPLLMLFSIWAAGRAAMLVSGWIGAVPAAVIDLAFLATLAGVIAREIIAAGNTRNLKVLGGVGLLLAGNAVFHVEAITESAAGYGTRTGIAGTLLLISLIGGRIIPSFTHNWLARRGPGRLPPPVGPLDMAAIAVGAAALASWVVMPASLVTAWLALAAGLANVVRLSRWAGERTVAEPLVLILHVGFAFVPLGFLLLALAILRPDAIAPQGALHAWTTGAIGIMTLAVMTRASLGHTGRPLAATWPIRLIYLAAIVAALARIAAAMSPFRDLMLSLSAGAWVMAFGGFVFVYAPLLVRPRE